MQIKKSLFFSKSKTIRHIRLFLLGMSALALSLSLTACMEKTNKPSDSGFAAQEGADDAGNAPSPDGTDLDTGNQQEPAQPDMDGASLTPSRYADSDFDISGAVLFETEHPVIDKGMKSICYIIENHSGKKLEYGSEYVLEIQKGGQWYEVPFPENAAFDAVAYVLPAENMAGGILNLELMAFTYVDGQYRIVKKVGDYLVKAEFSMGESVITPQTPFGYAALEELPEEYSIDDAIADGVVVFGWSENYNTEHLKSFLINVKLGLPAMVRIGFFTVEGDPVFYDVKRNVTYEGMEWYTLYHDSRRDKFSSEEDRVIKQKNYSYLVTDGETIFLSNFAEYRAEERFYGESRDLVYTGAYTGTDKDASSGQELIPLVKELAEMQLNGNNIRYKSVSNDGTYYISLNEEQLAGGTSFGYGTKGYGISDCVIPVENPELTGTAAITGILRVHWLDNETVWLVCSTEEEGMQCRVEFSPGAAMNGEDAFGEREYEDVSNIQW